MEFQLPEFSTFKEISWSFHVDESDPNDDTLGYDMIIGRDLLTDLGIIIDFKDGYVIWDGIKSPMKQHHSVGTKEVAYTLYENTTEPEIIKSSNERVSRILDACYQKADLASLVCQVKTLNKVEQLKLLNVLEKYKDLFDGTLGAFKTKPIKLEVKPGELPYHVHPFQIPKIHKETLKKELKELCKIGILRKCLDSQCARPSFIMPKKNGTVQFVTDFQRVNKKIISKPFPIPKINDLMQKLEGFTWATVLDLNMGYYHI